MSDYKRIEAAIGYLVEEGDRQPSLDAIAAHVHLSPHHFQRLFCRWAGTTPKRFLQALTLERGKSLLQEPRSLLEISHAVGLSGGSRLYDHFVQLEAVTPGEYRRQGKGVRIHYGVHATPFGKLFLAVTPRGINRAVFLDFSSEEAELAGLQRNWPLSTIRRSARATGHVIEAMFGSGGTRRHGPLSLHVAGTNFQIAVWRALLRIPPAALASYSQIARALDCPRAARAVGRAVGANPVAFLIPCHRVIQQSGALGGYRWGTARKQLMQIWERTRAEPGVPVTSSTRRRKAPAA